ncbi:MAG: 4-alpha-glucanotransferase [Desulfohalobiaceae bacterium]
MLKTRASGLLLHITSLPSKYGLGDLGPGAYEFADFLHSAGQSFWQVLPLNPTSAIFQHSPYSSDSAFAGNPLLISPEILLADGLLKEEELPQSIDAESSQADYEQAARLKESSLQLACQRLQEQPQLWAEYKIFCHRHQDWLYDYALFKALKFRQSGQAWTAWPQGIRDREPEALEHICQEQTQVLEEVRRQQFLFFRQWDSLKEYCNRKAIQIIGDMPIYVSQDSADVWSHRELFQLNPDGTPSSLAGVPPDYFSSTGQLWGNPLYNWQEMQNQGFAWWLCRMGQALELFDLARIDHFRGLVGYWEVPAGEKTAVNGTWRSAPAYEFFNTILRHYPYLPVIAEDLGEITSDVREVLAHYQLPNMKLLLFAFDQDNPGHPFLPHNYQPNCVVYTGTHDTNTLLGWFEQEATAEEKSRLFTYLGLEPALHKLHWAVMRLGMMSVANLFLLPVQDLLGLDHRARMNFPGTEQGNWLWRLRPGQLDSELAANLAKLTRTCGRL